MRLQRAAALFLFTCTLFVSSLLVPSSLQAQQTNQLFAIDVRSLMTTDKFWQSGLHRLSDQELSELNLWLSWFVNELLSSKLSQDECPNAIESKIDGEFEGWEERRYSYLPMVKFGNNSRIRINTTMHIDLT